MGKQICLLLFPLALSVQQTSAQQAWSSPTSRNAALFLSDSNAEPATAPEHAAEVKLLPDAPGWRTENVLAPAVSAPIRSKQPVAALESVRVFNKKFIFAHAAFAGSIVYDAELTHQGLAHHKCVESNPELGTHPSRGKIYGENLAAFGAVSGLDWVTAKMRIPYLPYVGPAVESVLHITGGSKWLTECW